jgi:hypothetical protein
VENWQKRALDLVWGLSQTNDTSPSVIPYTPQKTRINGYEHRYFKRSSPEAHGISSQRLIIAHDKQKCNLLFYIAKNKLT